MEVPLTSTPPVSGEGGEARGGALSPERLALKRRFPTAGDLRQRAKRKLPHFAFEFIDGGAGTDGGIERNWAALDAIELVPRYGNMVSPPPADTQLFGRPYAAPLGISPVGGAGSGLPGAETYLARAAQAARVPYTMSVLSSIDIERAAELAPDVLWFQLVRFARNDHAIGFDLMSRAEAAGAHVLVLTYDTPTLTTRPRQVKSGIMDPFRLTLRLRLDALTSPLWLLSLARNGAPQFAPLIPYMDGGKGLASAAAFLGRESRGSFTFTWDEIARYRDKWQKPLVLKGVLHPADAERAVSLGLDGIFVTNHGGRQIEALPASVDVLPAIAAAVGGKATIILDSGVRSGIDIARAVAAGADAAFAGKAFMWSLGALGERGPAHLIDLWIDDVEATLGQLGCQTVADLRSVPVRHRNAYRPGDFTARE
jgi:L-lactate dehydrogenase (cytochrome)